MQGNPEGSMTTAQRPAVDDLRRRSEAAVKSSVEETAVDANDVSSATVTAIATAGKSMVGRSEEAMAGRDLHQPPTTT